jgi:hypothetical protein
VEATSSIFLLDECCPRFFLPPTSMIHRVHYAQRRPNDHGYHLETVGAVSCCTFDLCLFCSMKASGEAVGFGRHSINGFVASCVLGPALNTTRRKIGETAADILIETFLGFFFKKKDSETERTSFKAAMGQNRLNRSRQMNESSFCVCGW